MTELLIIGLTVWRLTSLLVHEDGPIDGFARIRRAAGTERIGELSGLAKGLSCVWCVSVWIGLFVAVAWTLAFDGSWRLVPFEALSGSTIAIVLERLQR